MSAETSAPGNRQRPISRSVLGLGALLTAVSAIGLVLGIFVDLPNARTQLAAVIATTVIEKSVMPEISRANPSVPSTNWLARIEHRGSPQLDDVTIEIIALEESLIASIVPRNIPIETTYQSAAGAVQPLYNRQPISFVSDRTTGATNVLIRVPRFVEGSQLSFLISTSLPNRPHLNVHTASGMRDFVVWDAEAPGFFQRLSSFWATRAGDILRVSLFIFGAGITIVIAALVLPFIGLVVFSVFSIVDTGIKVVDQTKNDIHAALDNRPLAGRISDLSQGLILYFSTLKSRHDRSDVAYFCLALYIILLLFSSSYASLVYMILLYFILTRYNLIANAAQGVVWRLHRGAHPSLVRRRNLRSRRSSIPNECSDPDR